MHSGVKGKDSILLGPLVSVPRICTNSLETIIRGQPYDGITVELSQSMESILCFTFSNNYGY